MTRPRCDRTAAWAQLQQISKQHAAGFDLRAGFAQDAQRFAAFSQQAPYVFADLSKNLVDAATQQALLALARETCIEEYRDAMFAGERINNTEHRAVKHWLLRAPRNAASMAHDSGKGLAANWRRCMPRWRRCWPSPSACVPMRPSPTS